MTDQEAREMVERFKAEERENYRQNSDDLMRVYAAYDKTVLSLSSGAIGVCVVLFKESVRLQCKTLLIVSTCMFILSVIAILLSYLFGVLSFKKAIQGSLLRAELIDFDVPRHVRPLQLATDTCNVCSGVAFIAGVVLLAIYVMASYA